MDFFFASRFLSHAHRNKARTQEQFSIILIHDPYRCNFQPLSKDRWNYPSRASNPISIRTQQRWQLFKEREREREIEIEREDEFEDRFRKAMAEISREDNRGNERRQRLTLTRVNVCARACGGEGGGGGEGQWYACKYARIQILYN